MNLRNLFQWDIKHLCILEWLMRKERHTGSGGRMYSQQVAFMKVNISMAKDMDSEDILHQTEALW